MPRIDLSGYATDDEDRRVADLHYADAHEYGVGRNTSAEWTVVDGQCTSVSTCPLPTSEVERVAPRGDVHLPGVEFAMERLAALASTSAANLAAVLEPLVGLYETWIDGQRAGFTDSAPRRQQTAKRLVANMRSANNRIAAGIAILKSDDKARLAFRFMNEAIAKAARRRSPEAYPEHDPTRVPKWRPFQLALILLNLAGLVDRRHDDREIVDLLFFPTGGGKTEAYLGLAAFKIAHRRITHPGRTGAGVTVIMRYTRVLVRNAPGRSGSGPLVSRMPHLAREGDAERSRACRAGAGCF